MHTREFVISGRVQGVGFRYHTLLAAQDIGVTGYVRNLADGRVQVCATGNAAQLTALRTFLQRGPTWARVDDIAESAVEDAKSFPDFRIRA